jgi:hypothetical protein
MIVERVIRQPAFLEDAVAQFVALMHNEGMRVVGKPEAKWQATLNGSNDDAIVWARVRSRARQARP